MRHLLLLLSGMFLLPNAPAAHGSPPPQFVDVTEAAGLRYVQHVPPPPPACVVGSFACEVDRMTGGAAVADVDGDGDFDLFVTRFDAPDLLFLNRGDGTFEEAGGPAGLAAYDLHSNGAAFGDVDNDGDPDLLVATIGTGVDGANDRNYLFMNDGTGHFTEEAIARGADVSSNTVRLNWSVAFGDYDRDGWLDLHVTEWLNAAHSRLLRNRGAEAPGHFEDVTEAAGLSFEGVDGFASTFVDLDDDGWQDLAVAADFGTSRLFWNQGDGTFLDGTVAAGVGTDENGMGSTFGDFDADGDLDWFVTSIRDPEETCSTVPCSWGNTGNRLYRNEGGRSFSDATDAAGVRDGAWGWGAAFFDLDNDGDQDLAMTNGMVIEHTEIEDHFNADPMRVWRNDGSGAMTEVSEDVGIADFESGKGLLTFDYDGDGDLDLSSSTMPGSRACTRAARRGRTAGSGFGSKGWRRIETASAPGSRSGADPIRNRRSGRSGWVAISWARANRLFTSAWVGAALGSSGSRGLPPPPERPWSTATSPEPAHHIREGDAQCGRFGVEAVLVAIPILWRRRHPGAT